ncbi:MAG: bifunctional nicotinamidase/pyrazinamidase [Firmicutes bacterium]|nr:bifunctional nicotinamidase/pyrazinamidase [Bacillota bacterium]
MIRTKALLLVDIQNDFLPGGALAIPEGDQVIPVANQVQTHFELVVATQDWHPANHGSFASNHPGRHPGEVVGLGGVQQVLWPAHCVQGTWGAEFAPALQTAKVARVFRKGTDPGIDSYSGFFDNGRRHATGLAEFLQALGVGEVYLVGLATDYCVRHTAIDGLALGFTVYVIEDGCRGANVSPGDADQAIRDMREAGARIIQSGHLHTGF